MSKVAKEKNDNENQQIFVIIILACFGDILACNTLVQNIKALYPDSKTVFIVDKPWEDVAKYQKDVDEVFVFDKRGKDKGLLGMFKFAGRFPYRHMDYLIKIHDTERVRITSFLLRPKKLIPPPCAPTGNISIQERNAFLLKKITDKEIINYPITYNYDGELADKFKNLFEKDKKYVVFCTTSKLPEKDMPVETSVELINELNKRNYNVIYTGTGQVALEHAKQFKEHNCKFIDLVNQTTITDLACILKHSNGLISVDTGTMHFGYAMRIPTVCIFYKPDTISLWAPREELYKVKVITDNFNTENILNNFETLMQN